VPLNPGQCEALRHQMESRAAVLRDEIAADARENLNAEPEMAALQRDIEELRDVEAALVRLQGPGYGLCGDCGGPISLQRLQANPAAKRCASCQSTFERA
jgi:DnaK suppressor protein